MNAESEQDSVDVVSPVEVVGWMGVSGPRTAGPRWTSMFEPFSGWQQPEDCTGRAVTTFACQPREAVFSPTRRLVSEQNTFQLGPSSPHQVFRPHLLQPDMQRILWHHLHDKAYNSQEAPELCKRLADAIKDKASRLDLPRYKFVSDVMIGQKQDQGLITGSRCLFDESRDNFVSASYENKSLFAVATLYGLYYE
ncbi:dynein light chain Tctex-type protein 2B-like [Babylonia areolata]|uniref:dynein light chain Tctex-type protein 2B-like n=1 Tax=Babylonia areolata TaxID=304850 RepID=UPI003FD01033